ncbi:MAG: glycine oxidase ThiO [Gemmatimonadetes bacterium]|nr:glycine oxidase ThiO [Gemmatimonadota bacterium]
MHDCIVIGAGLVGASAARALAAAGRKVLLLDRGPAGAEASAAAAGMLAAQIEASADDLLLPLALAARDRYPELIAALERSGHRDLGLVTDGITLVALDDARARELEAQVDAQRALGLDAEWLDREALSKRHPGIGAEARGALLSPRDGAVNNAALTAAILADDARLGVEIAEGEEVTDLCVGGGRATGVRTARAVYDAEVVVLAAGAWTPTIRGLPRPVPVEPVRGQLALAPWPPGEPKGILFGRDAYIVPRGDDSLLGSTMERAGFEKATTGDGIRHIRTETGALLPALLTQAIRKTWSGLRPMTPDGLPIIGRDPDVAGLIYATGHGRNGILLGPLTGEIVRDLVVQGETSWPIAPYSISRFSSAAGH